MSDSENALFVLGRMCVEIAPAGENHNVFLGDRPAG
jgi:hypothetical protein